MSNEFIEDGITALSGGINSDIAPQLLPKTTAAFATNATFRGNFITNRPSYRKISLSYQNQPTPTPTYKTKIKKLWDTSTIRTSGGGVEKNNFVPGFVTSATTLSGTGLATVLPISDNFSFTVGDVVALTQYGTVSVIAGGEIQSFTSNSITIIPNGTYPFNSVLIPSGTLVTDISVSGSSTVIGYLKNDFNVPTSIGGFVDIETDSDWSSYAGNSIFIFTNPYRSSSGQYEVISSIANPIPPQPTTKSLVDKLFQGCCYYRPLFGSESLMASIGGRLFQFIIGPGTTSSAIQEGVTYQPFTAPSIGGQVDVSVNSTYPFQIGQILYVLPGSIPSNQGDSNRFQIVSITGNSNLRTIRVSNLAAVTGTVYAIGDWVSVFPTINDGESFVVDRTIPNDPNSDTNPVNWLWQSERWVIVNDGQKLPIFFDGTSSRRSVGNNVELPVGKMGAYVFGRNWVCLPDSVSYMAGDIVGGSSGTVAYNYKDAVLKCIENTYLAGGGNFSIPGNLGQITAMSTSLTLDASLGQGPIQVFTEFGAFSCNAPVDRLIWQSVTNPIQTQSLIGGGAVGQDTVSASNSDLIFRSANPTNGFRSLILGRRDFNTWGNTPISAEVNRVMDADNKGLLAYSSSIQFDNRMIGTALPTNGDLGVYHQGLVALNFDPVSSLAGKAASIWDGFWSGLNVLKLCTGTFGGIQRAFAFVFNEATVEVELYELLPTNSDNNFDNGTIPIPWSFESASLFENVKGKDKFELVQLVDGELYIGSISGNVSITAYYKPEFSECWFKWKEFSFCSTNTYPKSYRSRLGLGQPDYKVCNPNTNRPAREARSFQVRLAITGSCKVFGVVLKAVPATEEKYAKQVCDIEPCSTNDPCLQFPLSDYSLNAGKRYTNDDLTITVTCPNGDVQNIFIQAGTVSLTLPWSNGFTGPEFPPITLGCKAGGNITRNVPNGSTQIEIDAIANEMIIQCATAIAQSQVGCATIFNDQVVFNPGCTAGQVLTFTGTIPEWITIDLTNNTLVGAANVYAAETKAAANALAQSALDTFANTQIGLGNLTCVSPLSICTSGAGSLLNNIYGIVGYYDGMIQNP